MEKGFTMSLNVIMTTIILVALVLILLILIQQGMVKKILGLGSQEDIEACNTEREVFCSANPKYCWNSKAIMIARKNITCAEVYGRASGKFYFNCSAPSISNAWTDNADDCEKMGGIGP